MRRGVTVRTPVSRTFIVTLVVEKRLQAAVGSFGQSKQDKEADDDCGTDYERLMHQVF